MSDISEEKLSKFFAEAFKEVVLPGVENLSLRLDKVENRLTGVEEQLGDVKDNVASLSRKFDAQQERLDKHAKIQENLDKRVGVLEVSIAN